jgi:hypothetical protein
MKQVNWAGRAYKTTQVNWAKTQAQIYKILGELGIYEIRFTNMKNKFALEFLVQLVEGEKPRAVRVIVPIAYSGDNDKEREKELNIVQRILFNHLKAKFVAVQSGLTEFEQEFMAHLLITDKQGNSRTVGEMILPEYKKSIEEGKGKDFKLLPGPEDKE